MNAFDCWIPEGGYDLPLAPLDCLGLQDCVGIAANDAEPADMKFVYFSLHLAD